MKSLRMFETIVSGLYSAFNTGGINSIIITSAYSMV